MSEELWSVLEPMIEDRDPMRTTGRPRSDARAVLEAIIYRETTDCGWRALPEGSPNDATVHRTFLRWQRFGVLQAIAPLLAAEYHISQFRPASGPGRRRRAPRVAPS